MKDSWFEQTQRALVDLEKQQIFDMFEVCIATCVIRVCYPKNSAFKKFEKAFYQTRMLNREARPALTVYCIDQANISALPSPPINLDMVDSFGNVGGLPKYEQHIRIDQANGQLQAVDLKRQFGIYYIEDSHNIPT